MTSEQVMTMLVALVLMAGCHSHWNDDHLSTGIYPQRQLWAVVPVRNESGSLQVDGAKIADHLANQLENEPGIDTIPVNRVLAGMEALQMPIVASPADALALRRVLGVDALLVGSVDAYDPYVPPKLGITVELYVDPQLPWFNSMDTRQLSQAAVDEQTRPMPHEPRDTRQPIAVASGYFDAGDPRTKNWLQQYAAKRGPDAKARAGWRLYEIDMDLYTEFVTHVVASRLIDAEAKRLAPPEDDQKDAAANKPPA